MEREAKDGIQHEVCVVQRRRRQVLCIGKLDAQVVQLLHEPVEERGILALRIPYDGRVSKVLEVSRRHQTIAALVAWATRHQDALAIRLRWVAPVHGLGTR